MNQDHQLFSEGNPLCQFNNSAEQEYFSIKRDIYIESQRSLRHDPSPNPNKPFRLARGIYENYLTLIRCIKNLHNFLNNYKLVLIYNQKKKALASGNLSPEDSERLRAQLQRESPPLIINKTAPLKETEEKQAISYATNKLKSMVLKARYKQSTTLEHLTQTYITKLKNALIYHIRYREDKPERNKLLELETIKNELIIKALTMIKRKFDVIELKKIYYYKIQPTAYLHAYKRGALAERPIYFINFFTESILFIAETYINFDQGLLFCPIVRLEANAIKISDEYLNILSLKISEWDKFQLYVQVYHIQTGSVVPIFYSKLKELTKTDLHADRSFPQRLRDQMKNLQKLVDNIDSIKRCIFAKMILNWIATIFDQHNKPVEVIIQNKFKVVIRGTTEVPSYEYAVMEQLAIFRPEILTNILLIASERKNVQRSRKQLKQTLRAQLEATIFKLVSEKVGSRVSWPLECSSLGHYYYEYNSDRIINRGEVKKFFSQF